jgi:hypothetical protein
MVTVLPRWLVGVLTFGSVVVAVALVVAVAAGPAQGAVGLDPRVPGPSNPVGPNDFNFSKTYQERANFDSGGSVVLSDVRFLDGFDVRNGTAVTVRDCYVHSPEWWGVDVYSGSLLMEDCQIGGFDEPEPGLIGVAGNNVTLRRVKIEGYVDGIRTGTNSLYDQIWVSNMREVEPDDHTDGLQDLGGSHDWTMRYSRIDARSHPDYPHYVTSALLVKTDFGTIRNVTLEGNYLNGGAYTVYFCSCGTSYPAPSNITIRNNAFGRDYTYGISAVRESSPLVWENNYWADTGQYIDPDGDPTGGGVPPTPPPPSPPPTSPPPPSPPPPSPPPTSPPPTSPPPTSPPPPETFVDVPSWHTFAADIDWLVHAAITKGCNPPTNNRYCPASVVTRGQMAAFLVRALHLTNNGGGNRFIDDNGSVFESDIAKVAAAGITKGCNPPTNNRYCPDAAVNRGQMAAFLHRAFTG